MASTHRLVIEWTGSQVKGRAVTVLHFDGGTDAAPPVAAVAAAFEAVKVILPAGVTLTFPTSGDTIESSTGELISTWTASAVSPVVGTGVGAAAAGVGACINWITGAIVNGRRVRGRTFIVPLCTSSYDTDGTLTTGAKNGVEGIAVGIKAAGPLVVWHRPTTSSSTDGEACVVSAVKVSDKVSYLSSRRD